MILYHGTSQIAMRPILEDGIRPINIARQEPTRHQSNHPGMVYLTDVHAPYYAWRRCMFDECARAAIIEIDTSFLNMNMFTFDERVLEQCGRDIDELPKEWDESLRLAYYREILTDESVTQIPWMTSLSVMGSVAYEGTVPPEAIKRVVVVDLHVVVPKIFGVVDPEITTKTHLLRKDANEKLTNVLLTEELEGLERYEPETS